MIFSRLCGKNSLRVHRKDCLVFKEFRSKQRSQMARDGFKRSMEKDPARIKRIRERAGKKISRTILANKSECKRRAKRLANLNRTEAFRKKASETAIKTSARKDIQEKRSLALDKWRKAHPIIFR
jgi:hypothetical protein